MRNKLLKLLGRDDYAPATVPDLLKRLRLPPDRQIDLEAALDSLLAEGRIIRTKGDRHILADAADLIPGVIQITRGGRGFVQPDAPGQTEISIAESATDTAMHGDRVLVRLNLKPLGLRKPSAHEDRSGSVVRVLERARSRFVGTLERGKKFLHVIPDDPRLPSAVHVPEPRDVGRPARVGDKVVVEILGWESRQMPPEGEVVEVLGAPDEEGVDMLSVLRHYDLPLHFPKAVLQEAEAIARSRPDNQPSREECAGRTDCRRHRVITIDPDDAKDFDDAICVQREADGRWRLWVHIADVSHYVSPGSALDLEARKRGNSTYLVDRVIPMLPEALSNELCSLKPGLDRLTKCVEFVLDRDGRVAQAKFYAAVIHSQRRYAYQEAFAILQRPPRDETEAMLHDAHGLAQKLRARRFANGSLNLDFPENKIRLDEQGRVLRIERMENDASHQLIEEFMLLANEAVAGRLLALNRPAVHRIHEAPKEKRLNDYREEVLSHGVRCGNLSHRPEVQKLLAKLGTLPIGQALKIGFLKSLMRARYAAEPLGHYGLAKKQYAHFTSPIRRYADLVVHRALFERVHLQHDEARRIADHISATERNSSDAERDSREVKLYAFLSAQIESGNPQTYAGLVTDVRNFGFFVDVAELGMSGLVPLSALTDDFYLFDPGRGQLLGRRTRRLIRLGETLPVQILRVDRFTKRIDFRPAEAESPRNGRPPQARGERQLRQTQGKQPAPQGKPGSGARQPDGAPKPHRRKKGPPGKTVPPPSIGPTRKEHDAPTAPRTKKRPRNANPEPTQASPNRQRNKKR
jgi:ribonuclease R